MEVNRHNPAGKAFKIKPATGSTVKHVFGVISGKGGVGKTFVSSYLAVLLRRKGLKVAVLDADVTGASIPTAFGINDVKMFSDGKFIYPAVTLTGIQVSSANLLIDKPGDPVIWRGPMASNLALQFYSYVVYAADVMIVDFPPGTSDVQLSLMQSVPLDGLVLALTPQGLVNLIANKARKMADMLNVPILGGVMNMEYATCPSCNGRVYPFGEVDVESFASGVPLVSEVPFDPEISAATDHGAIEKLEVPYLDNLASALAKLVGGREGEGESLAKR